MTLVDGIKNRNSAHNSGYWLESRKIADPEIMVGNF
jgi:hypothetical protein